MFVHGLWVSIQPQFSWLTICWGSLENSLEGRGPVDALLQRIQWERSEFSRADDGSITAEEGTLASKKPMATVALSAAKTGAGRSAAPLSQRSVARDSSRPRSPKQSCRDSFWGDRKASWKTHGSGGWKWLPIYEDATANAGKLQKAAMVLDLEVCHSCGSFGFFWRGASSGARTWTLNLRKLKYFAQYSVLHIRCWGIHSKHGTYSALRKRRRITPQSVGGSQEGVLVVVILNLEHLRRRSWVKIPQHPDSCIFSVHLEKGCDNWKPVFFSWGKLYSNLDWPGRNVRSDTWWSKFWYFPSGKPRMVITFHISTTWVSWVFCGIS